MVDLDPFLSYLIDHPTNNKVLEAMNVLFASFEYNNYYKFTPSLARQLLEIIKLNFRNRHLVLALLFLLGDNDLIEKLYFDLEDYNREFLIPKIINPKFLGRLLLHERKLYLIQAIKSRLRELL